MAGFLFAATPCSRRTASPLPSACRWPAVRAAGLGFVALDVAGVQSGAFTQPLVVV